MIRQRRRIGWPPTRLEHPGSLSPLPQTGGHGEVVVRKRVPRGKGKTTPRSKTEFTREELRSLDQLIKDAPIQRVKRLTTPAPGSGKTCMFPPRPTSARGRKLDPRKLAAWNEWEMAPDGKKPLYRTLAVKFYGQADCPLCGKKQTISFGDNGYLCVTCAAQFLPAPEVKTANQTVFLEPPKLVFPLPAGELNSVLKLSRDDIRRYTRNLKEAIRRLHLRHHAGTHQSS